MTSPDAIESWLRARGLAVLLVFDLLIAASVFGLPAAFVMLNPSPDRWDGFSLASAPIFAILFPILAVSAYGVWKGAGHAKVVFSSILTFAVIAIVYRKLPLFVMLVHQLHGDFRASNLLRLVWGACDPLRSVFFLVLNYWCLLKNGKPRATHIAQQT